MSTIQLPNPNDFARKRLRGEKLTNREFALKTADLAHGNEALGKRSMNWVEISNEFDCDVKLVHKFRDLAISLKLLESVNGIYKKPDIIKQEHISSNLDEFKEIPEIKIWFKFMEYSKLGGTLKGRNSHLNKFKHVCDTLKVHPSTFISSGNTQTVISSSEEYYAQFLELHKNLKSTIAITKKTKAILSRDSLQRKDYLEGVRYSHAQPFLSFLKAFKYGIPVNSSRIFAQSIKKFHAKYSDVAITPEQFEEAKRWAIENEGIDSDFFRWLFFGIESCARRSAILTCQNNYYTKMLHGKLAYCLKVTETKTDHINGGVWTKFITIPELQQSIDAVSTRSSFLIEDRSVKNQTYITSKLKQLYRHLKIGKKWLRYIDDESTGYAMNHSTHTLRHFGCQLWLQRLGSMGIGLVTLIGGWNGMDEARSSYGKKSEQELLDEIGAVWKEEIKI